MKVTEHPIQWDQQKVARLWDYYSRTTPYCDLYFSKLFGKRILKKTRLPFDLNLAVLDFGCGPGFLWDHLRRLNVKWHYTGLDFSKESIQKLSAKASGDLRFKGAVHAVKLPTGLPDEHFDAILLCEVIEHLSDDILEGILSECSRLLAPSGVLIITTPNDEDLSRATKFCPECCAVFHEWQHVRSWTSDTLGAYMRERRFEQRFSDAVNFAGYGLLGFARRVKGMLTGRISRPHLIAGFGKIVNADRGRL